MKELNNVKMFINTYKDFDYVIPYNATIISRYKLNNTYDVPIIYADTLNDCILDKFRDSLCDVYAILYVANMKNLPENIGFVQYKRFFKNVQNTFLFTPNSHTKIDVQFKTSHMNFDWDIVEEFLLNTKYKNAYIDVLNNYDNRFHSMFVLPKEYFLELANMLKYFLYFFVKKHNFNSSSDIINFYNNLQYKDNFDQTRAIGYISERLISIYANYLKNNGIKIIEQNIIEL